MATIYDKNKNICGIITKGNPNENVETDSAYSGKYSKFINVNISKKNDNYAYYLPLSFNENTFYQNDPNRYFNYSINNYNYNGPANNGNLLNGERCWFNNSVFHEWMNTNGKWNSLFSTDLLERGYNYLSSYLGTHPSDGTYICYANKNQDYFLKPQIKHNETSYDNKYNYFNTAIKLNSTASNLYITTLGPNTSSTDVTITATDETSFKLGYNGIISGDGLTNYIESIDTTASSGRPFWQRFFFVSIKGGYNSSESYNTTGGKTNTKICTFDQNTGLENESNSYLNSIPLKYKKLRNDMYLIQDDHYKNFQTYTNDYYVIKKTIPGGSIRYYRGSPQTDDMNDNDMWEESIDNATHLVSEPLWYTADKTQYEQNHPGTTLSLIAPNGTSVRISLPVVMNASTATITIDKAYYITASNDFVYTGTNVSSNYTTGQWSNSIYYLYSANANEDADSIKFFNKTDYSYTGKFSTSNLLTINELTYELSTTSKYKWVLYSTTEGYWISGYSFSNIAYTPDINNDVHIFNSSAEANAACMQITTMRPDVRIIDSTKPNKEFINYDVRNNMQATMFSSFEAASAVMNLIWQNSDAPTPAGGMNILETSHIPYQTYLFNNNCTTAGINYIEIPKIKWLSLNYFFTPV